jgi:hypothetical protein
LVFEVCREILIGANTVYKVFTSFEVVRFGTLMEFVLECVLDLVLEIVWDVIAVGDVSDSGEGN